MFNKQLNAKKLDLIRKTRDNLLAKKSNATPSNQKTIVKVANSDISLQDYNGFWLITTRTVFDPTIDNTFIVFDIPNSLFTSYAGIVEAVRPQLPHMNSITRTNLWSTP